MERDADGRLLVVVDASFLINFLAVDRMDILGKLPGLRFHLVNHVRAEVRHDDQRARLGAAMDGGVMTEIEITDPAELRLYDEFRRFLGDGESASLAVAVSRRWVMILRANRRGIELHCDRCHRRQLVPFEKLRDKASLDRYWREWRAAQKGA